jgi:hypothetical protein
MNVCGSKINVRALEEMFNTTVNVRALEEIQQ